jgi:hypothetical protein
MGGAFFWQAIDIAYWMTWGALGILVILVALLWDGDEPPQMQ